MRLLRPALASLITLVAAAAPASAHILLTYPAVRTEQNKQPNCGATGSVRGEPTILTAGSTIEVTWDETVDHPGHFRVSFDDDGEDDFIIPDAIDDFTGGPSVLADDIEDLPEVGATQTITLPDIACDNCTLQVIQVMYDKPPYGDGNDLYYQCADITLVLDTSAPDAGVDAGDSDPDGGRPVDPGDPDAGGNPIDPMDHGPTTGGCSSTGDSSASFSMFVIGLAALVLRQRRRRAA